MQKSNISNSIYNNRADVIAILRDVDPETGEMLGDVNRLAVLELDYTDLMESVLLEIKEVRAFIADIRAEEIALSVRRHMWQRYLERLEKTVIDTLDGEKFETPRVSAAIRRNPESVHYVGEGGEKEVLNTLVLLGLDDCITYQPVIRKTELKKMLKAGTIIPGAELVQERRVDLS